MNQSILPAGSVEHIIWGGVVSMDNTKDIERITIDTKKKTSWRIKSTKNLFKVPPFRNKDVLHATSTRYTNIKHLQNKQNNTLFHSSFKNCTPKSLVVWSLLFFNIFNFKYFWLYWLIFQEPIKIWHRVHGVGTYSYSTPSPSIVLISFLQFYRCFIILCCS